MPWLIYALWRYGALFVPLQSGVNADCWWFGFWILLLHSASLFTWIVTMLASREIRRSSEGWLFACYWAWLYSFGDFVHFELGLAVLGGITLSMPAMPLTRWALEERAPCHAATHDDST